MNPTIIAHRGASGHAPENTEAAFKRALELNADGVEFDVQLTKDNKVVVIHDERVDRLTNAKGFVHQFTLKEIKKLDFGQHFSEKFKGQRILTLEETLQLVNDFKLINIELKNWMGYPGLEEKTLELVDQYNLKDKVIISSFNHYSLRKIKQIAPETRTAMLYFARLYRPWIDAIKIGAEALHPYYLTLDREIVENSHLANIKINAFTVNKKEEIKKMIDLNIDGIITDFPDRVLKLL